MSKSKDFELYKKHFTKYQERFGLTGYEVYFEYKDLGTSLASIAINHSGMVATASLNSKRRKIDKPIKNIRKDAKHEAIHLLMGKVSGANHCRFITESEIDEAEEELTIKLCKLIPD